MGATSSVRVLVPAKINLFLAVRGVRDDGYHDVTTVLQTVDLYDELVCSLHGSPWALHHPAARQLMELDLQVDGGADVPVDDDNLVLRAARAVLGELCVAVAGRDVPERARPRTTLRLTKAIPVAAGMAGGSADAAAALLGLDRLWGAELEHDLLEELAADIGSDVPFCLHGGSALASGTGAATARILARGEFHWVVCPSDGPGLSTPEVYAAYDALPPREHPVEPDLVLQALRTSDAELLAEGVHNDLGRAAVSLRPQLGHGLARLTAAGALTSLVSGSGPTLLGLARDRDHAEEIAAAVGADGADVRVVRSPAGGPRVTEIATPLLSPVPDPVVDGTGERPAT